MDRVDLHEVKEQLQQHLTDGLVTIVGSGLSAAEGLPTMSKLEAHLRQSIPQAVTPPLG